MDTDRRQRAMDIFSEALDLPRDERERFVAAACGDDGELSRLIEELLRHDEIADGSGFLDTLPLLRSGVTPSAAPALSPGDELSGRYRIDALVGRGGMGEVYRATDLAHGVTIAVKTIRTDIASDPAALRRFKQEVLLARSVSHPSLCRIYDLGRDEAPGVTFLTMEFLAGETLAARLRRQGPLHPDAAMPLVRDLAEALNAAHRAGVIHGDFKSGNIMLVPGDHGDRAVVTDFGLAVTWDEGGETAVGGGGLHERMGTVAYMSPEQLRGERLLPASDLYAMGVVLGEILTGEIAGSSTAIEPGPLRSIGEPWDAAIRRLRSSEPRDRFATAGDLILALEGRFTGEAGPRSVLPAERDPFVGRASELASLARRLEEPGARLVTITGPGGIGKTRLAVRYGGERVAEWPGGVWFCDLSEARSIEGIALAVATALGVPLGKADPIVQLGHAIAGRGKCLVILDNLDHATHHAGATLGKWLERTTGARFLATSREPLGLPGEIAVAMPPLDPATRGCELFEVRVRSHRPGFVLDDGTRALVQEIVARVGGFPLAIELAAARLRTLSLQQVRERLGANNGTTLRATMEWSWELLDPWERSAVEQAAVFEGGFTLEAAEAVISLLPWHEAPPVLDVIQSLVNKSWLRARPVLQSLRFRMYTAAREYASETPGPARAAAEIRHGSYFAAMGSDEAIGALDRHGGVFKRRALQMEVGNLVAACRRALERADAAVAVPSLAASKEVLGMTGPVIASLQLGEGVASIPGLTPGDRARVAVLNARSFRAAGRMDDAKHHYEQALAFYRKAGDRRAESVVLRETGNLQRDVGRGQDARRCLEDALAMCGEAGDRRFEGVVLGDLATVLREHGQMKEAEHCYRESLAIHRMAGNRHLEGIALINYGALLRQMGRMDEARQCYAEALGLLHETGNRKGEGIVLGNMGNIHRDQGRMQEAQGCYESALEILRDVGDRRAEGITLTNVGLILLDQGLMSAARERYQESLLIHREVGNRREEGVVLSHLGSICSLEGEAKTARHYYEEALALHREVGNRGSEGWTLADLGRLEENEGRAGEAERRYHEALAILREVGDRREEGALLGCLGRLQRNRGQGAAGRRHLDEGIAILRSVGDQLELGRLLCVRGEDECREGNLDAARSHLAEAESLAASLAVMQDSELGRALDALRRALG